MAVGGKVPDSNGYFINPTIIDNPKENSRLVVEEPFGTFSFFFLFFNFLLCGDWDRDREENEWVRMLITDRSDSSDFAMVRRRRSH